MVRTKQRWVTVELSTEYDIAYNVASRTKPLDRDRLLALTQEKRRSFYDVEGSDIVHTLRDLMEDTYGVFGVARLTQCCTVAYWNKTLGIFTVKILWAHNDMFKSAIPFLHSIKGVHVRPRLLGSSATFHQAQHFLLNYLHERLRDQYHLLPRQEVMATMAKEQEAIQKMEM